MTRSKWKNFFIHFKILKKKILLQKQINFWCKNSVVSQILVNKKLIVYCGKLFKTIYITDLKITFKIGEFCTTRSKFFHKNKIKVTKSLLKLKKKKQVNK